MSKAESAPCMVCGSGPAVAGVTVWRVNRKGIPGVWTCGVHAKQALKMYANQHGANELSDEARKAYDKG